MGEEYFLDRHRPSFEALIGNLSGGKLARPAGVPDDVFLSEVEFYEIEKAAIDEYKRSEGYIVRHIELPDGRIARRVWELFEYPDTSFVAFLIALLSVFFTCASIVCFCAETVNDWRETHKVRRSHSLL